MVDTKEVKKRLGKFTVHQSVFARLEPHMIPAVIFLAFWFNAPHISLYIMRYEDSIIKYVVWAFAIGLEITGMWLGYMLTATKRMTQGGSLAVTVLLIAAALMNGGLTFAYYHYTKQNMTIADQIAVGLISIFVTFWGPGLMYVRSQLDAVSKEASAPTIPNAVTTGAPTNVLVLAADAPNGFDTVTQKIANGASNGASRDALFRNRVVQYAESHNNRQASAEYGVPASTVDRWVRSSKIEDGRI